MIYNGPSIYNQGGGGGGYKDGGALVDGEFIKVENNTVSSYDNTSRNDVNFYFEVADGEIINSVVELTTTVNATIHVYVVKNGLFIPLGNVGGDTVNAGDDYKLNVVGDSFVIENVTTPPQNPEFALLMGVIYPLTKIGNFYYTAKNFKGDIGQYVDQNGERYYLPRSISNYDFDNGFEFLNDADFSVIDNNYPYPNTGLALKSVSGWRDGGNGNNSSGFNAFPKGYWTGTYLNWNTEHACFYTKLIGSTTQYMRMVLNYNDNVLNGNTRNNSVDECYNVRLVLRT